MLTKILIANRGEIAVRVIRTCRELGIATVAIYSDLDRDALHVRLADEAFALGGETAAESYLNTEAILDVIARSGADGVHPGYGFFSENADFARAITDRGVTFIGPPPEAIEVMGDKISSRHAAQRAEVRGVPGTNEFLVANDEVREFASEHGYPVAVKAAFGGGGRGMKVIASEDEVDAAVEAAQREGLAYFGRDECYLERYLARPRHVEVQVMADAHGNCIYLGTRDCSAQRRHQKLIEEAPAPGIDQDILAAMGEAAVSVAQACGYEGAGTVEFLFEDGEFFFLEMNTRLQVEHPATEMITRVDLVEQQIRVASGEVLAIRQEDVATVGHAIEVRINAEDPAGGQFLPSPGRITSLIAPNGFGTRFDAGYQAGDEVSQFYDNLVGKLICWGPDRDVAIRRTLRALDELSIEGVATTVPADKVILSHQDFATLAHYTTWVENDLDLSDLESSSDPAVPSDDELPKVRRDVDVEVNGKRFSVAMWVPESVGAASTGASAARPRRAAATTSGGGGSGSGQVTVPMQGTIVKVEVAVGDTVDAGDTVIVLEAMKMENNVTADKAGTISEVRVSPGDAVGSGDVVVVIE